MSTQEILFLIGRILYGGYFLFNGVNHFVKSEMLAGYAGSKGVPWPKFSVYFSGLFILLGGLGIVLGTYVVWSVALIVIFLVVVSFKMHAYWKDQDPNMKMGNMVNFLKNMALLGAALMFIMIATPWPIS